MMYTVAHYIHGKTYLEDKSPTSSIYNPALGERIGEINIAGYNNTAVAIMVASGEPTQLCMDIAFGIGDFLRQVNNN